MKVNGGIDTMREYLPGVGLLVLGAFLFLGRLMGIGQSHEDPIVTRVVFVIGYQLAITYWVVGVGLIAHIEWGITQELPFLHGATIGAIAIVAVYLARTFHPEVGTEYGQFYYSVLIVILLFIGATTQSDLQRFVLCVVAIVPPIVAIYLAPIWPKLVFLVYLTLFIGGVFYGIPSFVATRHMRDVRSL